MMLIQKCNLDWLDKIYYIENDSFDTKSAMTKNELREDINAGHYFLVLNYDNDLIGYFSIKENENNMYLDNIVITKKYRGNKKYISILDYICNLTKKKSKSFVDLHVMKNSSISYKYKNYGFITEEIVKDFYDKNLDAEYMRKIIE